MEHDFYRILKAKKLACHIDPNVLNCLLLIRQASETYIPSGSQLTLEELSNDNKATNKTPWEIVANSIYFGNNDYISVIRYAMSLIKRQLPFFDTMTANLQSTKIDEAALIEIIDLLSCISLNTMSLSTIYESRLCKEARDTTLKYGDFYTPQCIVRCLLQLLNIKGEATVYDPCCGSGAMFCIAKKFYPDETIQFYGQTLDKISYEICQMNLYLHGLYAELGNKPANTLLEDLHINRKFDYIISNPPFNLSDWYGNTDIERVKRWEYGFPPRKNANYAWLQHIISHLKENGRAVVLLPNGSLTTQNSAELDIRKKILCEGLVEAIIALPAGLFYNTKIPCCIWIINKSLKQKANVLLVDARHIKFNMHGNDTIQIDKLLKLVQQHRKETLQKRTEWYAIVPLNEIEQKHYILSPNLYTKNKEISLNAIKNNYSHFIKTIDMICLKMPDNFCHVYLTQWNNLAVSTEWKNKFLDEMYLIFGGVTKRKEAFGHGYPMVDVKTILYNPFLPNSFSTFVEVSKDEIEKYNIKCGDILLNRTSETINQLACCSVACTDCCAVFGSYVKRLRPKKEGVVNPFYMAGYFRSAIYRREVEKVSPVYTTRANMNVDRLSAMSIYYPDLEMQDKIGSTLFYVYQFQKTNQNKELNGLLDEFVKSLIEQFITYPVLCLEKE